MPMEIAIMIEGQDGLTWPRWQRLASAVEQLGFVGLYRSDHFTNAGPPDKESLELWLSLAWLASHTQRIEFGPLVTPVSFRHPAFTARIGAQLDDLSGGRLTLGVGAGWQHREHTMFGFDLLPQADRMDRFEEGLEVISRLLQIDAPASFDGQYYQLHEAVLLPRPQRPGGPPLLIGGNGPLRTLPLVARFADEWNAVLIPAARFAELNARLDSLLAERGRPASAVRRSMMTGVVFGRDQAELRTVLNGRDADELREQGLVVGTPGEVQEQLGGLASVGVQRVMLQWLALDDLDRLEALAATVL
ncbi:MAG: TIGR03560 family F420-dependent LLM class oxidoreductase [Anaerolineae bacterium]|nr:TIGR03560 family F420-dependent LLM class oxidoreductase [Anaerolineae bacterium]